MLPSRDTATASARGITRASRSVTGRSIAVTTRPRKTATAISWNRPRTEKTAYTSGADDEDPPGVGGSRLKGGEHPQFAAGA